MATYLLDTNIISRVLRKEAEVSERLEDVLLGNETIILCPVVLYEIRRGLVKKVAVGIERAFEELISHFVWDEMVRQDWEKAAELWALSVRIGAPRNDADILIASHAHRLGAVLVTDNESHFQHLGLETENWCKP